MAGPRPGRPRRATATAPGNGNGNGSHATATATAPATATATAPGTRQRLRRHGSRRRNRADGDRGGAARPGEDPPPRRRGRGADGWDSPGQGGSPGQGYPAARRGRVDPRAKGAGARDLRDRLAIKARLGAITGTAPAVGRDLSATGAARPGPAYRDPAGQAGEFDSFENIVGYRGAGARASSRASSAALRERVDAPRRTGAPGSPGRRPGRGYPPGGGSGGGRRRRRAAAPQGQLVAALDLEEGAGRRRRRRRRPAAADDRAGRAGLPGHHDPHRGLRDRAAAVVERLLQQRQDDDRHLQHRHQPAAADLGADPAGAEERRDRRRGPALLHRRRGLADRHPARRLRGPQGRRDAAGRFDHHPAVRPELLRQHRHPADDEPQDQGDLRGHQALAHRVEGLDPDPVPEHGLPRGQRLRCRRRRADLLRQAGCPGSMSPSPRCWPR